MGIKCCKDCVAPKRHTGCHENCSEYLYEKKLHDERRQAISEKRQAENALYSQRERAVHKALRHRRRK